MDEDESPKKSKKAKKTEDVRLSLPPISPFAPRSRMLTCRIRHALQGEELSKEEKKKLKEAKKAAKEAKKAGKA